jgi:predicted exporter
MVPPLCGAIASLGLLGLLGQPISLFNIMALFLVLGIGVDYGLFFRETGLQNDSTMLAIALSSLTTILGFGLLAFSATAAIRPLRPHHHDRDQRRLSPFAPGRSENRI